ncbi:MAG: hypothetical protein V1781_03660 [Bacteroidota bacterium]
MKKYNLLLCLTLISVLTLTSCEKLDVPKETPACIKKEIRKIKSDKVRNPPASVWQYDYNGQTVYYIPPYCCDIPSQLFDNDCNQICSPDGGLSGAGDGKCPDFFSQRKNEKLIWQDDRK